MRQLQRIMLAVALAVSATLLIPAGTAHAENDPYHAFPLYSPIVQWEGKQPLIVDSVHPVVEIDGLERYVDFRWGDIEELKPWPWPEPWPWPDPWPWPWPWPGPGPVCLSCPPPWVNVLEPGLDPDLQREFLGVFNQAHGLLITSMIIEDREAAQKFRDEAAQLYLKGAELIQETKVDLYGVGLVDEKTGVAYQTENREALEFGKLLTTGTQWSIEALENPKALEGAMDAFEKAFASTLKL